jgi:2-polyprenyl-3-methyl-5-hydroxy-6-metoxy-1,4-benzoquinol methylase
VVDFETAEKHTVVKDFFESYDIVATDEESPYLTNSMCVMSNQVWSLKHQFNIKSIDELKELLNQSINDKLYEFTNSFFTRKDKADKRHKLVNAFIYNTFDLKYTKIDDLIGQRRIKKRLENFNINSSVIQGKTVLDIGSNVGGILLETNKFNPKKAIGLEYDNDKVNISNNINSLNYINSNLEFYQMDVESGKFYEEFNQRFDVVFCLAVIEHLKDKEKFIAKLSDLCTSILYFEGNSNSDITFLTNQLKISGFHTVEFIGMSNDETNTNNNNRPLFIARKEV